MRKVGRMKGMPTKLSAVGILVGTLIAIGNEGWVLLWGRVKDGPRHSLSINSVPVLMVPSRLVKELSLANSLVIMFLPSITILIIIIIIGNSIYCYIITQ